MLKKVLIGSTVSAMVLGGVYSLNQIKQLKDNLNQLENKEKQLEKQINQLSKELKEKDKKLLKAIEKLQKQEERKRLEEQKRKEEEKERNSRKKEFILTFYTTLSEENGGYTTTCRGEKLKEGTVASNYYPLDTKIKINNIVFTVSDRGGKSFNKDNRLDVLVERKPGESDYNYKTRVNNLGKIKVTGYIMED